MEGWDWDWLGARPTSSPLPWSYREIVQRLARDSPDLLDLGTGGGEWLAKLATLPPPSSQGRAGLPTSPSQDPARAARR